MSIEYVSPSALEHYDEKIKGFIDDKIKDSNVKVDDALSSTSTNPVQNKVINTMLDKKVSTATKINNKALSSDVTLSASDVGADASGSASAALSSAKNYIDGKIDALVGDGASTTLDTIGEISKAIEEHQDVTDALNAAIGNKVDKVSGKGLSTNDLTGTLKSNYDAAYTHSQATHAPSTAEKNVIVGIQKNGTDLNVDSSTRKVNITVPTKTSELNNDSGFLSTSGGGIVGTLSACSTIGAPVTTISTNCNLSGGMLKTSPGGNTEITYGVTITDPSTDGSRATINGYKILHEGNLPSGIGSNIAVPFNTELVFGTKNATSRGFIKATSNSLLIKAPGTYHDKSQSDGGSLDTGGAGLKLAGCYVGILPYSTLNSQTSMNLGSSTYKFGTIYSAASALNSDAKLKKDIESLSDESDKYLKTFDELNFVRFKWAQNMNLGLATPASSRYHLGLIAQELEKTLADNGIYGGDTGAIQANFFADNTSEAWISGGYQVAKEGYDYSENVWNYKHGLEYEWINEVIEKDFYEFNNAGGYNIRPNIKYIMFEDISKVASEGNQPPLKVNSITLVNKNDEYIELELTENGIAYYDHDNDTELKVPLSDAHLNEDGSLTINYNKMWATYMIEVPTFAFADYKTIIIDVDYIGEYKCYMIPEGYYKNANVWDRGNNDTILYDYSLNYNEIYALSLYALQETRKEFIQYKAETTTLIADLTDKINRLAQKVGE